MTYVIKSIDELHKILVPEVVILHYEKGNYSFPSLFIVEDGKFHGHQQLSSNGKTYSHEKLTDWGFDVDVIDQFYKEYPEYTL